MASAHSSTVTKWRAKLRVVPHSLNKISAPIGPTIQATACDGLLHELTSPHVCPCPQCSTAREYRLPAEDETENIRFSHKER